VPLTPQSRASDADLPRTAGGFELRRELGRGGMGIVYEARELASGRTVALKILAADLRVSDEAFERFRREARLAASISDHHCVFVYGAHEVEGAPAIAMELCPGETLDQKLASKQTIPVQTAVRWTLEILAGLEAAHERGIVHRDVKPSNCFTTADGRAKIGDFGLSRTLESDIQLTQSGSFLGSPLYASPEQIRGREVDLRSDMYSCGATLYALLTGRAPHSGSNIGEVLARILSETPPAPRAIRADIPRELERVVMRSMDRDPKRRFQDYASFREALQPFAAAHVAPAGPIRRFVGYAIDFLAWNFATTFFALGAAAAGLNVFEPDPDRPWMLRSVTSAAALACVPWILSMLFEGWLGAGPGKWLMGQRVVAVDSLHPSFARAAWRATVFYAPGVAIQALAMLLELGQTMFGLATGLGTIGIVLGLLSTIRRSNGYRAVHDFASGTRVIQKRPPFGALRQAAPPPSAALEPAVGVPSTVGAYEIHGMVGSSPDGVVLAARDAHLDRSVWIHARRTAIGAADEARRALSRGGRLRWLDSLNSEGVHYEVFESPGGISLVHSTVSETRIHWPTAQRFLAALADELAATSNRGDVPTRFDVAQIWIDRLWNPRLLDFPIGGREASSANELELLTEAARRVLLENDDSTVKLPRDLPAHAEPVVARLLGHTNPFVDLDDARRELAALGERPSVVTRAARAAQMTVGGVLPALLAVMSVVGALWILPLGAELVRVSSYVEELDADRRASDESSPPSVKLAPDEVKAREILISHMSSNPFGQAGLLRDPSEPHREIVRDAVARYPKPTGAAVVWAQAVSDRSQPADESKARNEFPAIARSVLTFMPLAVVLLWGMCGTISAFLFDGGMTLMLCGIRVRSRRGLLASRWRCAWRCLISWVPFAIAYGVGAYLTSEVNPVTGWTVTGFTALVHAIAIAFSLWRPTAGLQDRVAGTTLVVR
jgi:hypothetical protein